MYFDKSSLWPSNEGLGSKIIAAIDKPDSVE